MSGQKLRRKTQLWRKHYCEKECRPSEVSDGTTVFSRDTYEALRRLNLSEPDYEG